MRWVLVAFTVGMLAAGALAQVQGEVESVGFQNLFRPDCWTPMVVRLRSTTSESATYRIQVVQQDADRTRVVYWRLAAMEGAGGSQSAREKRFWMYFRPQPTDGGLADTTRAGTTLKDLQKQLRVIVTSEDGGREIAVLPITSLITSLDAPRSSFQTSRGTRLIVCVTETGVPPWSEFQDAVGVLEDVVVVNVSPRELPENVIGYEAVDAVLWLNADAASPAIREDKLPALQEWVREGGKLVVCQPAEWQKLRGLNAILPVTVQETAESPILSPLKEIAQSTHGDAWDRMVGPFRMAIARPKPGAYVEQWIDWGRGKRSPWLARQTFGAGSVTWVAQDLGDPSLTRHAKQGWHLVWQRLFQWRDQLITRELPPERKAPFAPADLQWDAGVALLGLTEHPGRSGGLVLLTLTFFALYGVVAGPGVYALLVHRKQTYLSWFAFAATALGATVVTAGLVRVVLRGPPQLKHATLVRLAPNEPAVVHSRLGLYIPRNGVQQIEMKDAADGATTFLTPFAIHPHQIRRQLANAPLTSYEVPVRDATATEPAMLEVPFRSTIKKFEARWVGSLDARIDGTARLQTQSPSELAGLLTNNTGRDLHDVYLVFNSPAPPTPMQDRVYFIRNWEKGTTLDLARDLALTKVPAIGFEQGFAVPTGSVAKVRGVMETTEKPLDQTRASGEGWVAWWYRDLRVNSWSRPDGWVDGDLARAFAMISVFDRLPPARSRLGDQGQVLNDRFELLRRGVRRWDVSHAAVAGQLVVLAMASGPLPFPLEVEGERIEGDGVSFYQCIVPLQRETDGNGD